MATSIPSALSVAAFVLAGLGACRQAPRNAPTKLVAEYLTRDERGERLQPAPWFRSVSAWEDEPAWDAVTLIRSFRIGGESHQGDTARITVTYDVLGTLEGTPEGSPMRLVPHSETQQVEFVLTETQGRWLFTAPSIPPHVLADSILAYRPTILSREGAVLLDSLLHSSGP